MGPGPGLKAHDTASISAMADIKLQLALEAKCAAGDGDVCFADEEIVKLARDMARDGIKFSLTHWEYTSVFRLLLMS